MRRQEAVTDRRRQAPEHVRAASADLLRRVAAAAADLSAAPGDDRLTTLRHVQLLAEELTAHAGWLRRSLVAELVDRGQTHSEVARVLGVSRQRVTDLAARVPDPRRPARSRLPRVLDEAQDDQSPATLSWAEDVQLDALFQHCTHGLAIIDPAGRFLRVNPALARLLQREPHELVGVDYRQYKDAEGLASALRDHVALRGRDVDEVSRRTSWRRADGERLDLELRVWPVRPAGDTRLIGYVVEVWPVQPELPPLPGSATAG